MPATSSCDMESKDMEEGSQEHHWAVSAWSSTFSTIQTSNRVGTRHFWTSRKVIVKWRTTRGWWHQQCSIRRTGRGETVPSCHSVKEAITASISPVHKLNNIQMGITSIIQRGGAPLVQLHQVGSRYLFLSLSPFVNDASCISPLSVFLPH